MAGPQGVVSSAWKLLASVCIFCVTFCLPSLMTQFLQNFGNQKLNAVVKYIGSHELVFLPETFSPKQATGHFGCFVIKKFFTHSITIFCFRANVQSIRSVFSVDSGYRLTDDQYV